MPIIAHLISGDTIRIPADSNDLSAFHQATQSLAHSLFSKRAAIVLIGHKEIPKAKTLHAGQCRQMNLIEHDNRLANRPILATDTHYCRFGTITLYCFSPFRQYHFGNRGCLLTK